MAKALDILVRIKNLTDSTVAVARSVVPPHGIAPIKAKKLKDVESVVLAADAGTIEILSPDEASLRMLAGLTNENTGKLELTDESIVVVPSEQDDLGQKPESDENPEGSLQNDEKTAADNGGEEDALVVKTQGEEDAVVDVANKSEAKADDKEAVVEKETLDLDSEAEVKADVKEEAAENETLDLDDAEKAPAKKTRQSRAKN